MKPLRLLSYWARHRREKCTCGGYHFPHRRTGGACDHSPRRDFYRALRHGATLAEAQAELSAAQLERMFPLPEPPTGYLAAPEPFDFPDYWTA